MADARRRPDDPDAVSHWRVRVTAADRCRRGQAERTIPIHGPSLGIVNRTPIATPPTIAGGFENTAHAYSDRVVSLAGISADPDGQS